MSHSTTTAETIARAISDLATIPEICTRLLQMLNEEDSTLDDIGELIQTDPGLTARVLRLANSPFYGRGRTVGNLNHAMMVVGTQSVVTLVLASCSVQSLSKLDRGGFDLYRFWRHAVFVSLAARELALHHHGCPDDQAFLAGLLHDVGLLGMASTVPDITRLIEMKRRTWQGPTYQIEETYLGFHHGQVGGALLRQWAFPEALVVAVEHHHGIVPEAGHGALQHTLIVADALAHRAEVGRARRAEELPFPEDSLAALGMTEEVVDQAVEDAQSGLDAMLQLIIHPSQAA